MAGKCWIVYTDMIEAFEALKPAELGRLALCAVKYSTQGEMTELLGNERFTWPIIKSRIDEDNAKQAELSKIRKACGSKSHSKRNQMVPNGTNSYQLVPNATNCNPRDNNRDNNNNNNKKSNSNNKKFIVPTREEVRLYAQERNSTVDPDRFFDFYDAGGWADSKGTPVRNWKQKFITWEKKDAETPKKPEKITNNPFMQMLIDRGEL